MPSANPTTAQTTTPASLEPALRTLLHNLHSLQIQAHHSSTTPTTLQTSVIHLVRSLQNFASQSSTLPTQVPSELLEYVENGRNPEIYTREFVEMVQRGNQSLRGREEGFRMFGDVLSEEMARGMPEVSGEVGELMRERPV